MKRILDWAAYAALAAYAAATGLLALGACGYTWAQELLLSLV
jgi:hypothetical protein